MKKKRGMAVAAALTLSMAMSVSALAASPSDISGHWATGTITQWTSKGYISGYPDGTFKPDNSITRAEFVVLVNKAMGYTKKGNAYFRDVNTNYWGYDEIQKGVSAGYVKGDPDGSFRPNDSVTRQEAAVMISKILDLETNFTSAATYNDYRYIPSWSVGYVGAVSNAKIMAGYPDGSFKADRVLSRAEAVIALDKVLNYDGKSDNKDDDKETKEDYTLEKTSLKDMTIKGDLVISSSLKSKAVSLDNVTVKGTLIVKGGGTITADDCDIKNLEMNYADATFKTKGDTEVKNTTFLKVGKLEGKGYDSVTVDKEFSDKITIDASINEFTLDAETDLRLLSSTVIKSFTATKNADRATINFSSAEVKDMDIYDKIKITGKGDIKTMTVYVSGVTSSIKPDDLNRKNGADKPDYTSSSSSSGSSSSSRYDDLTASKDKTYSGGKYDDVKVTADGGIKLKDMTIYGNLTIDEDVENGDVDLEDVTVKGNVYIYAGGKNTITFKDCDISGNITAKKTYGSTQVGLSFDSSTASDLDGTLIIQGNGAIVSGSSATLKKVKVDTSKEVSLNTNVTTLDVTTKTTSLTINSGRTVNTLNVSSSAKNSDITLNGTVKTLNASGDTKLSGSGTVEKIGGNGTVTNGGNITVKVETVTLNKTALALKVGNTEKLIATVKPDKATNKTVTWTSDNKDIADVGSDGTITAKKSGTAKITATADGKTATCTVTVSTEQIPATAIELNKATLDLTVGGNETLTATVTPSNSTDTVEWSSDKLNIATVDENGKVTAVAVGEATITAKAGSKTATCTVTVKAATVAVTGVSLNETTLSLEVGKNKKLTATITPENASNKNVTWSGGNEAVSVGSDGTVTANKVTNTSVSITVTTEDGSYTATCAVTVTAASKTELAEAISQAKSAKANIKTSTNGSDILTTEKWVTSEVMNAFESAITAAEEVNEKENATATEITDAVTALNSAKITFESAKKDGTKVEVTLSVNHTTLEITEGETKTITASVNPSETEVTWESSNKQVATVSNGTVTAVAAGSATITATAGDKTATCEVTVKAATIAVTGVTLSSTTLDLTVGGENGSLTATVIPSNATDQNITWASSAPNVATVSNGIVTAVAAGTADITATVGGKTATCIVTVKPSIAITATPESIAAGSNISLSAAVTGGTATSYTWTIAAKEGTLPTISGTDGTATVSTTGATPGTYTVSLKVMINNKEYTVTKDISVKAAQTPTA